MHATRIHQDSNTRRIICSAASNNPTWSTSIKQDINTRRIIIGAAKQINAEDFIVDSGNKRIYLIDFPGSLKAGTPIISGYWNPLDENGDLISESPLGITCDILSPSHVYVSFSNKKIRRYTTSGTFETMPGGANYWTAVYTPHGLNYSSGSLYYVSTERTAKKILITSTSETETSLTYNTNVELKGIYGNLFISSTENKVTNLSYNQAIVNGLSNSRSIFYQTGLFYFVTSANKVVRNSISFSGKPNSIRVIYQPASLPIPPFPYCPPPTPADYIGGIYDRSWNDGIVTATWTNPLGFNGASIDVQTNTTGQVHGKLYTPTSFLGPLGEWSAGIYMNNTLCTKFPVISDYSEFIIPYISGWNRWEHCGENFYGGTTWAWYNIPTASGLENKDSNGTILGAGQATTHSFDLPTDEDQVWEDSCIGNTTAIRWTF